LHLLGLWLLYALPRIWGQGICQAASILVWIMGDGLTLVKRDKWCLVVVTFIIIVMQWGVDVPRPKIVTSRNLLSRYLFRC
jgi:Mn2+/Fe2+ NRAMP family transporter